MKTITLPIFEIVVTLDNEGSGTITTDLHIEEDEEYDNDAYNSAIDGLEAMILACACSGIDIEDTKFLDAIETAVDGIANNT